MSSVADVAQLVESQIVILVVAGSSPVVRPTEYCSILRLPLWSFFIFLDFIHEKIRSFIYSLWFIAFGDCTLFHAATIYCD